MPGWQVVQMSLGQGRALARLTESAGNDWLFGPQPLTQELLEAHDIAAVYDDPFLHVLVSPPGSWVTLDRTGEVLAKRTATRAEVMTVQLRSSRWWASMRGLLEARSVNPATTVMGDAFDDDVVEDEDGAELTVDAGVFITEAGAVIAGGAATTTSDPSSTRSSSGTTSPTAGGRACGGPRSKPASPCRRMG